MRTRKRDATGNILIFVFGVSSECQRGSQFLAKCRPDTWPAFRRRGTPSLWGLLRPHPRQPRGSAVCLLQGRPFSDRDSRSARRLVVVTAPCCDGARAPRTGWVAPRAAFGSDPRLTRPSSVHTVGVADHPQ